MKQYHTVPSESQPKFHALEKLTCPVESAIVVMVTVSPVIWKGHVHGWLKKIAWMVNKVVNIEPLGHRTGASLSLCFLLTCFAWLVIQFKCCILESRIYIYKKSPLNSSLAAFLILAFSFLSKAEMWLETQQLIITYWTSVKNRNEDN